MSKYNFHSHPSGLAKKYLLAFLAISVFFILSIWPVNGSNVIFLVVYIFSFSYLIYSSVERKLYFKVDKKGEIEVQMPENVLGKIHQRSFYNRHLMGLCIEVNQGWKEGLVGKHKQRFRWFAVFSDSFSEKEYRMLARLIRQSHD